MLSYGAFGKRVGTNLTALSIPPLMPPFDPLTLD